VKREPSRGKDDGEEPVVASLGDDRAERKEEGRQLQEGAEAKDVGL
jgi:hypothetical protein